MTESELEVRLREENARLQRENDAARELVQSYVDRQGHDCCWYLPELFDPLAEALGIKARHPQNLPSKEEFCRGCTKYQAQVYPPKGEERI